MLINGKEIKLYRDMTTEEKAVADAKRLDELRGTKYYAECAMRWYDEQPKHRRDRAKEGH